MTDADALRYVHGGATRWVLDITLCKRRRVKGMKIAAAWGKATCPECKAEMKKRLRAPMELPGTRLSDAAVLRAKAAEDTAEAADQEQRPSEEPQRPSTTAAASPPDRKSP